MILPTVSDIIANEKAAQLAKVQATFSDKNIVEGMIHLRREKSKVVIMTISERHTKARQDFAKFIKDFPMTLEDLDGEEWREIEGFDDYLVSTCGRIKALRRKHRVHERILKPQLHAKFDYLFVWLKRNGQERRYLIHRLVAETFVLNPLNKPYVNHINGVKFCNEVSNLEWVTHSENIHHAFSKGLEKSGEEH